MHWMRTIGNSALLCAAVCSLIAAQVGPPLTSEYSKGAVPSGGGIPIQAYPPVIGRPFRAEVNSRRTETRPDGKQVDYEFHGVIARDSQGRVYQGRKASPLVPMEDGRSFVGIGGGGNVIDPAARVRLEWDDKSRIVIKWPLLPAQTPATARPLDACEPGGGRARSYSGVTAQRIESLGERTIQGISTRGCLVSTLLVGGTQQNGQPITVTDETWSSPEFRITLLRIHHDPRGNDEIARLDNISTEEPDADLFLPPRDYVFHDPEQEGLGREARQPPLSHPELIAGPWETEPDSSGAVDGIHVLLNTSLRESTEHLSVFQFSVYHRQGQIEKRGWFSANNGGGATWDGKLLRLNFEPRGPGQEPINLDLVFDQERAVWTGTIARNGVSKSTRLKRPGGFGESASSPFAGEWYSHLDRYTPTPIGALVGPYCLHIIQSVDGSLIAWEDRKPRQLFTYGTKLKVVKVEGNSLTLTNRTDDFTGGNEITYFLTLSSDGARLDMKSSTNGALPLIPLGTLFKSTGKGISDSPPFP